MLRNASRRRHAPMARAKIARRTGRSDIRMARRQHRLSASPNRLLRNSRSSILERSASARAETTSSPPRAPGAATTSQSVFETVVTRLQRTGAWRWRRSAARRWPRRESKIHRATRPPRTDGRRHHQRGRRYPLAKAGVAQKATGGSNPSLSANRNDGLTHSSTSE